jgi:ribonuclease HI
MTITRFYYHSDHFGSVRVMKVKIYTDGGARGNPGPAAYGVVIHADDDRKLVEFGQFIGIGTNNEAEYQGLLAALDKARELGADEVDVASDSELMVKQLIGIYRVKAENLRPLFDEVRKRLASCSHYSIRHVRRDHPIIIRADQIVNQVLDDMELARSLRK